VNAAMSSKGFVVMPGFVEPRLAKTLYNLLLIREYRGEGKKDQQVPRALSFWGDSTLDAFLVTIMPEVEHAAGCELLPTYCYARLYVAGDELKRHRDRQACEVVATVHLGHAGDEPPPPVRFAPDHAVHQRPGDAVIFRGDQLDHWRDPFAGTNFGQLFVNYVRADGPNRGLAFDGRRGMFPPSVLGPVIVEQFQVAG
jgi:hypothetical protein